MLIREASGVEPRAFARFGKCRSGSRLRLGYFAAVLTVDRGVEVQTSLAGLGEKDVEAALGKLVQSNGSA